MTPIERRRDRSDEDDEPERDNERFVVEAELGATGPLQLDGLIGEHGSTPREWRASFLRRRAARDARQKVLDWRPDRLLIAHGECATSGAAAIIERALRWM